MRSCGQDQAAVFGRQTGMKHRFDECHRYRGDQYGLALLSRFAGLGNAVDVVRLPDGTYTDFEPQMAQLYSVQVD